MVLRGPIAITSMARARIRYTTRYRPTRRRQRPASSRCRGSPSRGSLPSAARASRTFRFVAGDSVRSRSRVAGSRTTRGPRTRRYLLREQVVERVGAALTAIQPLTAAEHLGVEGGIGHDLDGRVERVRLVGAHEHRGRATSLGDRDAVVPADDLAHQAAELGLRFGERDRSHDLTSLQTSYGVRHGGVSERPRRDRRSDLDRISARRIFTIDAGLLSDQIGMTPRSCSSLLSNSARSRRMRAMGAPVATSSRTPAVSRRTSTRAKMRRPPTTSGPVPPAAQ